MLPILQGGSGMKFIQETINGDIFVGVVAQIGAGLQYIGSFRTDMCEFIYLNNSDYIQIRSKGMIIAFDPRVDTWEVKE